MRRLSWLVLLCLVLPACGTAPPRRAPATAPAPEPDPDGFAVGQVTTGDGVPVAYTLAGAGEPTLVFVHGWAGDRSEWGRVMRALAPTHRVVSLDLPGHGESGSDRKDWTVEVFGSDVVRLLEALELRRVVLVGHAAGGAVALAAAARAPERVVAVVGVDTLHDVEQKDGAGMDALLEGLARDFVPSCRTFVGSIFGAAAAPELVARVQEKMCSARPEIALPILRAVAAFDQARALDAVRAPVRCIQGDTFPTNLEANRRHHGDFDVLVIPGTGHFPQLESPEDFDRALQDVVRAFS
ncbi:MAG TPA: alpha/beta hydrolase [Candidatus Polarisedimenticolaceae bacterium]|nr:alpha/beta hydrolase [Candidatus Polarisedimenticolaceae bacterium]